MRCGVRGQRTGAAGLAHPGLRQSEQLAAEVLSLPLYPELTDAEAEAVLAAFADAAS